MISRWPATFPRVVAELNLDVPGLLEASAGTGKTYAIEHLVLRALVEKPDWPLESMLLLSFTEKTAGELREKIRERLRIESRNSFWPEAVRRRFFEAHLRCDEASIHTLHGFCHATLRAHALENGSLFASEVAEDREILRITLDKTLRGPWAHEESRLRELLRAFDLGPSQWRPWLVQTALDYQPERRDILQPQAIPEQVRATERQTDSALETLEASLNFLENGNPKFSYGDHVRGFGSSKTGMDNLRKDVFAKAYEHWQAARNLDPSERRESWLKFFGDLKGNTKAVRDGFAACLPTKTAGDPDWTELAAACQMCLDSQKRLRVVERQHAFGKIANAAMDLRHRLAEEKKRQGVLSYDDMILEFLRALRDKPGLSQSLRDRIRLCVVDEFQDTDPLQWELLRLLCLREPHPIPLFLVGDPKQAIYGFRGGDLGTYLLARQAMRDLAKAGRAQGFSLAENHRSRPELITALNSVFAHPLWFASGAADPASKTWHLPEQSDAIVFTPALIPPVGNRVSSSADFSAPVILREFPGEPRMPELRRALLAWIAERIQALVSQGKYAFQDCAVLVRTNSEALEAERFLRRRGIPCRLRRRGGVFNGKEADQLYLLLRLLEDIDDPKAQARVLLLPFLRGLDAAWPRGIPSQCPEPLLRWSALALRRRWPEFFRSVLIESGALYRLAAKTGNGSEVQAMRNVAQALGEEGLRHGLTLRALLRRFEALRRGEDDDRGEVSNGGAEQRVTLMTLHLSKGLEFPVVFVAAAGENRSPDRYTLREPGGFRHVLDKDDADAKAQYQAQTLEEEKRLFYVGLTRAKHFLHLPLLPEKTGPRGYGPLGRFAGKALREAAQNHPGLFRFDGDEIPLGKTKAQASSDSDSPGNAELPDRDPWEIAGAFFWNRQRRLSSYSKMVRQEIDTAVEEDGRRWNREEGESVDGDEAAPETVTASDFPAGSKPGNALHQLLEAVDFAEVGQAPSAPALEAQPSFQRIASPILRQHGLPSESLAGAARLVWNGLHMPLPHAFGKDPITLAAVSQRKHEVEFLFPISGTPSAPVPENVSVQNGWIWGFIDLVFRHDQRYYLLDWKSNLLDRYDADAIAASMRQHHYELQYQLYSVALDKWLSARLTGYDPEIHFGGVYYLYLRGASPQRFSGFYHRPDPRELRVQYPARLHTALGMRTFGETEKP